MLPLLIGVAALPALIPYPTHLQWREGAFTGEPRVRFVGLDPANTKWLKDTLREFLPTSDGPQETLEFKIDPSIEGEEAYRLEVAPKEIHLTAATPKGLYWSLQTLRQLKQGDSIPCVHLEDAPAFAWRGVMSMYKFNVLHWHLTDDQGWRIEIKSHPDLTRIGAWRIGPNGKRYGGFYTQAQIKDIVAYAAKRNITVVPEIEMPGHSSAAIAADPALSCTGQSISVPTIYGVFNDVFCPGKESTFAFVSDIAKEVSTLFPSSYLHIGGDEVPKTNWNSCPDCQARIKAEGLKDEESLQGYFTNRASQIATQNGCQPIGWDEVLRGGAPKDMVVQIWNSQDVAAQAIANGNRIILSPQSNCYINRQPSDLPLQAVYAYDPLQGISDPSKVLGIETTLWSENISPKNCMTMFLPRGLAIAEIAWSNPKKDFSDFEQRVAGQLAFLDSKGIDYGSPDHNLVTYTVAPDPGNQACRLEAVFGIQALELRYTLDGSEPAAHSAKGDRTIEWPVGKVLRVTPFKNGKPMLDSVQFDTLKSLAYGDKITLQNPPVEPYTHAGPQGLTDGLLGTNSFRDGIWLGWEGCDLIADCDLGKQIAIHEIGLHCLQEMRSWILMPTSVTYETSDDGQTWQPFGQVANMVSDHQEGWIPRWFTAKNSARARFIRITARNYGILPSWHNGAGGNAWLFADEISVR